MHDPLTFEARLGDAYERLLAGAPVAVDPRAMTSAAATAAVAGARPAAGLRRPMSAALVRLGIAAAVLVGLLATAAFIGGMLDSRLPVAPAPTATATPSRTAPTSTPTTVVNGPLVMVVENEDGTAQYVTIYPDRNGTGITLPILGTPTGCPTFSPDGAALAYIGQHDQLPGVLEDLLIARPDGAAPSVAWHGFFGPTSFHQVIWSADSSTVAATGAVLSPVDPGAIVVGRRDGSPATIIEPSRAEFPGEIALSPDGRLVAEAYLNADSGAGIRIRTIADGSERTIAPAGDIRGIAWSPDGGTIAYVKVTSTDATEGEVWLVDLDRSDPRPLAGAGPVTSHRLAWSPDGRTLAVMDSTGLLRFMDPAGTELGRAQATDGQLTWAPDSRSVFVAIRSGFSGRHGVRVDLATGAVAAVAGATGFSSQCPVSWAPMPG